MRYDSEVFWLMWLRLPLCSHSKYGMRSYWPTPVKNNRRIMCLNNTIRLYFHFRVFVQLRIGLSPPHGELVCSIILLAGTVEVFEFICVCKGMSKTTFVSSPIKQVNFQALIAGLLDQCRVYLIVRSCRINQIHHSIKYLILVLC